MVYLAGGIAEDVVFGAENASVGRYSDREEASKLALDFVRRYGFDEEFQATYTLEFAHEMDKSVTDTDVEKMMVRLAGETHKVLLQHSTLLIALATALAEHGEIDSAAVLDLARQYGLELSKHAEGTCIYQATRPSWRRPGDNLE